MIKNPFLMIIAAALMLVSCINEEQQVELQLNLKQVSLVEGETVMLSAAVAPASGSASIMWRSLDNAVATVEDGLVSAVNPGQTWITASVGSVETGCLVTVSEQKVLRIDRKVIYMIPDDEQTLAVTHDPTFTSEVVWTSTDPDVATVEDGVVTAVSDGEARIVASIENGRYDTECRVYVMTDVGNESGDVFIMQGAGGDGSSWDNAGGEELLRALLNVSGDAVSASRLSGKKIHVAEGIYNICKDSQQPVEIKSGLSVTLLGGYPASVSGSSLADRDPVACMSTITVSDGRILAIDATDAEADITLDGLVLSAGVAGEGAYGGAVDCNIAGKLTFNDCRFTNCSSGYGGGAVNITSGEVHFKGCEFSDNESGFGMSGWTYPQGAGGAVRIDAGAKGFFQRCTFYCNIAHTSADIHIHSAGQAFINRCSFKMSRIIQPGQQTYGHGCSITIDALSDEAGAYLTLCVHNSTFSETKSVYTTYGGLPVITALNGNVLVCSTTVWDDGMGLIKARDYSNSGPLKPDNLWVLNTILANTRNDDPTKKVGVNLVAKSTMNAYCNVISVGGGAWSKLSTEDNVLLDTDFEFTGFGDYNSCYSWTLAEDKTIQNYAEKSVLAEKVKAAFPDFDTWLKTVEEDPYGIDQNGNPRNPDKMNPGAWDPYLETAGNE